MRLNRTGIGITKELLLKELDLSGAHRSLMSLSELKGIISSQL